MGLRIIHQEKLLLFKVYGFKLFALEEFSTGFMSHSMSIVNSLLQLTT